MLRQGNNAAYLFCLQEFTSASKQNLGTVILSFLSGRLFTRLSCRSPMLRTIYWVVKKLREESVFPWWKIPSFLILSLSLRVLLNYTKSTEKSVLGAARIKRPEKSSCSRLSLILDTTHRKTFHKASPPAPFLLPFPLVFPLFFPFYLSLLW